MDNSRFCFYLRIVSMKKATFNIFFGFLLTCVSLLVWQCTQKKPKEVENPASESQWRNLGDSAHYVGMQTCRNCHEDIYQSFSQTGMGQSFGLATRSKSAANWHIQKPIFDKYKNLYYQPYWRNDTTLIIKEYRLSGKDTIHKREDTVSYIIGSGQHTNSHIINTGGYLTQAPFTWYVQKGQWDLPPGFEGGYNSRFSRALGQECLTCHNAYPKFIEGSLNKYAYIPVGIDCERCHGPGSIHVQEKLSGKIVNIKNDTDFSIVNPAKLPYELQIDVCQRCHMQGNAVLKPGKTFYDFRPGMRLSTVMDVFMPKYADHDHTFLMASHPERLRKSPCFINTHKAGSTLPALTCITCHNPHVSVKATQKELFIAKCMECHPSAHKNNLETLTTKGQNCISCHMPRSSAVDIPHVTITDHNIRIVKENDIKVTNEPLKFLGLADMTDSTPSALSMVKGYLYFYEKFEHKERLLDSARLYLNKLSVEKDPEVFVYYNYLKGDWKKINEICLSHKEPFKDAVVNYQAAQALMNLNYPQAALPYMKAAVTKLPYQLEYRIKLGTLYLILRQIESARAEFEFVIKENPKMEEAWNNLGFVELLDGHPDLAMKYLNKSLALNPDYSNAKINIAKVWLQKNNPDQAKKTLQTLLKEEPSNEDAKALLQLLN